MPNDWDLYMLKLVNAARTNPAAENQLRGTNFSNPPVAPLAYDSLVGEAAENHNEWMSLNAGPQNSGTVPDTLSHYETDDRSPTGTPLTDSPGYTGASVGERLGYVGYSWSSWGENILWRGTPSLITPRRILDNHVDWWNSEGHRDNLMSDLFTVMGHDALNDASHWATVNFSRPLGSLRTFLLGVLYEDKDASGDWNPPISPTVASEGLGNIPFRVYQSGTLQQVGSEGATFANGGFSFAVGDGEYDVQFLLDGTDVWKRGVVIAGQNVDLGDLLGSTLPALPGDYNDDGIVDASDYTRWRDQLGGPAGSLPNDADGGVIGPAQYDTWKTNYGTTLASLETSLETARLGAAGSQAVPEPATALLLAIGLLLLIPGRATC